MIAGVFTEGDFTVSAIDTEQDLFAIPCPGEYMIWLDTNILAINSTPDPAVPEVWEILLRAPARPGGTERLVGPIMTAVAKVAPLSFPSLWFHVASTATLRVTQYTGTARAVPWALYRRGYKWYGQVDNTSASASAFRGRTSFDGFGDDYFNGQFLSFLTGALVGQTQPITDFADTNNVFTFSAPNVFTAAPANNAWFGVQQG